MMTGSRSCCCARYSHSSLASFSDHTAGNYLSTATGLGPLRVVASPLLHLSSLSEHSAELRRIMGSCRVMIGVPPSAASSR